MPLTPDPVLLFGYAPDKRIARQLTCFRGKFQIIDNVLYARNDLDVALLALTENASLMLKPGRLY
jgi:hypothetical protein